MRVVTLLLLLLAAAVAGPACIVGCSGDGITDCQVKTHAEANLVYPGASDVKKQAQGENSGQGWIENVDPTPAYADTQFRSADSPDRVIDWYDRQLKARGWEDAQTFGYGRYWQRGGNEEASINPSGLLQAGPYDFRYSLLSSRFPALGPAASPIGDPVSVDAVKTRAAGIQDYFGTKYTEDSASASRKWSTVDFAYSTVRLASEAASEQASPARAAYRLITFQIPEYYDQPERMDSQGHLLTDSLHLLQAQGFKQLTVLKTTVAGAWADEYIETRGDHEVYELALGYGGVLQASYSDPNRGTLTAPYRVATVSAVYAILPKACSNDRPDCVELVPNPSSAAGA